MRCFVRISLLIFLSGVNLFGQEFYSEWIVKPAEHQYSKVEAWRYKILDSRVDSLKAEQIYVSGHPDFTDTLLYWEEYYDEEGMLDKKIGHHGYHQSFKYSSYSYDSLNRLIQELEYNHDSSSFRSCNYYFQSDTRCMRYIEKYSNIERQDSSLLFYSSDGRLTKAYYYLGSNCIGHRQLLNFTDKQAVYGRYEDETDSSLSNYLVYDYDSLGKLLSSKSLNNDSSLNIAITNIYSKTGLLLKQVSKSQGDSLAWKELRYFYDPNNQKQKEQEFRDEVLISESFYRDGLLRKTLYYNSAGKVETLFVLKYY